MNRGYRILLIDDDPDFSAAVATYLEANGFTVVRAASGREGVALAGRERPALILLDIIMDERTDGLFAEAALRELPGLADVPIMIVSSLYDAESDFSVPPDRVWGAHTEFVRKPINPADLLARIRTLLDVPTS
jgi:DNA-binding response OmpR family regulator